MSVELDRLASAQALEVVTGVVRRLRQAAAAAPDPRDRLSLTEIRMLKRLAGGARHASELAALLEVTPATVSATVEALVQGGLVRREGPGLDRRAVPLALTAEGVDALGAARERQEEALASLLDRLRPSERRAVRVAIASLARILG